MADLTTNVAEEHIFHFRDGNKAHNLKDLREVIEHMPIDEFNHHVDDFNNDFANWVEFVYKDTSLASDLRAVTSQKMTVELLDTELGKYGKTSTPVVEKRVFKKKGKQLHEDPIMPTNPPQSISMPDGQVHHTVSTEAVHTFIVKEFLLGAGAGFVLALILMGILFAFGAFL